MYEFCRKRLKKKWPKMALFPTCCCQKKMPEINDLRWHAFANFSTKKGIGTTTSISESCPDLLLDTDVGIFTPKKFSREAFVHRWISTASLWDDFWDAGAPTRPGQQALCQLLSHLGGVHRSCFGGRTGFLPRNQRGGKWVLSVGNENISPPCCEKRPIVP